MVALTRLAGTVEAAVQDLSSALSTPPYEHRVKLNAGLPAIVLTTPDEQHARMLFDRLRARGHDAIRCPLSDVVATDDMLAPRRFQLDPDAIVAVEGPAHRLAWADVAAIIQAFHRTTTQSRTMVKEENPRLSPREARTHTVRAETKLKETKERVLYLFPRTGQPWSLRETRTRFNSVGDQATLATHQNFLLTVEAVRRRAPHAVFNDQLWTRNCTGTDGDRIAHLIARSAIANPYR